MSERARAFTDRIMPRVQPFVLHRHGRKGIAAARLLRRLQDIRPDVCYVLDLGLDGFTAASLFGKTSRVPFIIDSGDDVVALGRALGRGPLGMGVTRAMDALARRTASAWVVRGTRHQEVLASKGIAAAWIPDGVDVESFASDKTPTPRPPSKDNPLVIGMLGSVVWIPTRRTCYGWELVELIALLGRQLAVPVKGVVIGDGNGVPRLMKRCHELGVEDRVEFRGRVPYAELPAHLRRWHLALSTQSNDAVGQMRTTGKLPLYLAAGRFVLASNVGEAARLLPADMLCPYEGEHDPHYPHTLSDRILDLMRRGVDFTERTECIELVRKNFDYDLLATRVESVLARCLGGTS